MNRIYHTWDKWECYQAGFYETVAPEGLKKDDCEKAYYELLTNDIEFMNALDGVLQHWHNSCEHYLTNEKMNRIAWLGQAALCYAKNIPSTFRGGFNLLSEAQRKRANEIALNYLNSWLEAHGYEPTDLEGAGISAKADLY